MSSAGECPYEIVVFTKCKGVRQRRTPLLWIRHVTIASILRRSEKYGKQLAIIHSYCYRNFFSLFLYCQGSRPHHRHFHWRYAFPALIVEGDRLPVPAIFTNLYVHSTHIWPFHFPLLSSRLQHLVSTSFPILRTFYRVKTFHLTYTSPCLSRPHTSLYLV